MSADQAGNLVSAGGPWALVLGLVMAGLYAILNGKLVTASWVDRMTVQWEARLDESREREQAWRSAYDVERQRGDLQTSQLDKMIVLGETSVALLKALPPAERQ